ALAYAVPYADIIKNIAFGFGEAFYGPWPSTAGWVNPALEKPVAFDLTKANPLLAQSNVSLPASFNFVTPKDNTSEAQIATVVQGIWKQLGININVRTVTVAQHLADVYGTHQHAAMYEDGLAWDPSYIWDYDQTCGIQFNSDQWCDSAATKLNNTLL